MSSGNCYKVAITNESVYKIDLAFLSKIGINVSSLNSASIQLFGNVGAILAENNNTERPDDLIENAIEVADGGVGVKWNGLCNFLWAKSPSTAQGQHQKAVCPSTKFGQ